MFEEEIPQVVFTFTNEDGTVYRDALTFSSMSELRNTSVNERMEMMQERYDNHRAVIEAAQNAPQEVPEEPEPETEE